MAKRTRIYRAHPCAAFDDELAQWIGEQIEAHGGRITPEQFVSVCKPKASPGHKLFNWDRDAAAQAHWIERAQYHLRHVEIEIVNSGVKEKIRACIPVYEEDHQTGDARSYVSYDRIREVPNLAQQVIEQAARELKSWQKRYELYKSVFGPVFLAISELESELWPQQKPSQSTESRRTGRSTATLRKTVKR